MDLLKLGTRGSLLARMQSQWVADTLMRAHPGLRVELILFKTTGDQIADRPLHEAGGKGLFVKELEVALLDKRIDFAVHSFKDVPVTMPLVDQGNLLIASIPKREDARDVLVGQYTSIRSLPSGAKVGTGSMRRQCQLLAQRPDLSIHGVRGNIDTRLRKQREGEFDAVVLAAAGLHRSNLFNSQPMTPMSPMEMIPAAAQGALALQCRKDDSQTQSLLGALHDSHTAQCVQAERDVVRQLNGDCFSPIGALAEIRGQNMHLRISVGKRGGGLPVLKAEISGPAGEIEPLVQNAMAQLSEQGVQAHLHG